MHEGTGAGTRMGRQKPKKKGGPGLLAGAALLLALFIYSVGSAYETAVRIGEWVWHAHEVFQRSVSLATIISTAVFGLIIYGIYALHGKHIRESCSALFGEAFLDFLKGLRSPIAIISATMVSLVLVLIDGLPTLKQNTVPHRVTSATSTDPKTEVQTTFVHPPQAPASSSDTHRSPYASIDTMTIAPKTDAHADDKSRVEPYDKVERDVCDLSLAFSSQELAACEQYLKRHPKAKGTGGRIHVVRRLNNNWVIEPLVILSADPGSS